MTATGDEPITLDNLKAFKEEFVDGSSGRAMPMIIPTSTRMTNKNDKRELHVYCVSTFDDDPIGKFVIKTIGANGSISSSEVTHAIANRSVVNLSSVDYKLIEYTINITDTNSLLENVTTGMDAGPQYLLIEGQKSFTPAGMEIQIYETILQAICRIPDYNQIVSM